MKAITLPDSIRQFVEDHVTMVLPPEDPVFPYSEYWWKAVVCLLLSGRVRSTGKRGLPNLTDVNRVCKEGNYNQHYFQSFAEFLIAADVVAATPDGRYEGGKRFQDFLSRNLPRIKAVARDGLITLIGRLTPAQIWRPTLFFDEAVPFLRSFFAAFAGKSLRADAIGQAFCNFSLLPEKDQMAFAQEVGIGDDSFDFNWQPWLDAAGQEALVGALYTCDWAFRVPQDGHDWFYLNRTGRVMLGLEKPPQFPEEAMDLKVLADSSILAGINLSPETLTTLFRHCKIKAVARTIAFRLDKKTMAEVASTSSAVEELSRVLEPCRPWPAAVATFLHKETRHGGEVHFLPCRGLVRVEDSRVLDRIKTHPKLKGYLVKGGPPGYLVIKDDSDPFNFVQRCQEHGFEVKPLQLR